MEKQKCPEIRFKGFHDLWNEEKISDIGDLFAGGDVDNNSLLKKGLFPVIANALSNNGYMGFYNFFKFKAPAITITGRGDVGVARARFINFTPVVRLLVLIPQRASDVIFLENAINRKNIFIESTGVPQLTIPQLGNVQIGTPTFGEQTQIGNFFQNLDQSIALHEKKLVQTQNLKKAMLERMFPKAGCKQPEIRLKGFSGDWEVGVIGNVVEEVFRPIDLDNETEYRLVTVKRRNGGIAERAILKGKDILVKSQFEVKAGDYIISKRQVVHGATGLVPHELDGSVVSNEYLVGQSTDKLNIEFFALLSTLPEMYKKFFLSSYGVDIEKLFFDVNDWKKREISLPCLAEQIQISKFFKQLDETLVLQQQQLQTLKNLKQAFLEKMFV